MFRLLRNKIKLMGLLNNKNFNNQSTSKPAPTKLTTQLKKNIEELTNILGTSTDIVLREFVLGQNQDLKACLLFIDGLVNKTIINDHIIKPLMYDINLVSTREAYKKLNLSDIKSTLLAVGDVKQQDSILEIMAALLSGDTVLLLHGSQEALLIDTKGWESRAISEPSTEKTVRGPREGFVETLRFNTALLRRKIRNPNFTLEQMLIGEQTHTHIALAYVKGITNPKLVEEVKRRLNRIKIDGILESGYIEQLIEDAPSSPFSTVGNTEKPDVAAAKLLEGRVAVLVDGSPSVLTVPQLFVEGFQCAEDYYSRPYYASIVRMVRWMAFFISLLAPATYVALETYHQEFIPTSLLLTMAAAASGTPFPAVVETLGMGLVFEILREGGIRLPSPIGSAISIVGALVIGDAAISAGLVGAPVVIVVAITAIASFLVVPYTAALFILRLILTILAGVLGAFGVIIGLLAILVHLSTLRSFGAPYLSPLLPFVLQDQKDTFIRATLWTMLTRPKAIRSLDAVRQGWGLKPEPPEDN